MCRDFPVISMFVLRIAETTRNFGMAERTSIDTDHGPLPLCYHAICRMSFAAIQRILRTTISIVL